MLGQHTLTTTTMTVPTPPHHLPLPLYTAVCPGTPATEPPRSIFEFLAPNPLPRFTCANEAAHHDHIPATPPYPPILSFAIGPGTAETECITASHIRSRQHTTTTTLSLPAYHIRPSLSFATGPGTVETEYIVLGFRFFSTIALPASHMRTRRPTTTTTRSLPPHHIPPSSSSLLDLAWSKPSTSRSVSYF